MTKDEILASVKALSACPPEDVAAAMATLNPEPAGSVDGALLPLLKQALKTPAVASAVHEAMSNEVARLGQEAIDELDRQRREIADALIAAGIVEGEQP